VDGASRLTLSLAELLRWLDSEGYGFTTVTPATHARVLARAPGAQASSLRDVFGWNRAFAPTLLPHGVMDVLRAADLLRPAGDGRMRSAVRVSALRGELFAHSGHPTDGADAVFFGPDTFRFADLLAQELQRQALPPAARILDVGCGTGAGGILAARAAAASQPALFLTDINPRALEFATANVAHAGMHASLAQGDLFAPVQAHAFDLVLANPPYLNDAAERTYRHGGGRWGEALSLRIVREGMQRLAPGGRLVLYTGVAMADGVDPLREALQPDLQARGWAWSYRELDPDVFGEELEEPAYRDADRIAAVALVLQRHAS
jgi:SAM-dependent methyltransferase